MHPDEETSGPGFPEPLFRGFVEDADVRLQTKELSLVLVPAFHREIRLVLRSSTIGATLSVEVAPTSSGASPHPPILAENTETADVDSGVFRNAAALFTRLERARPGESETVILGGLRLIARLDAGKGVRQVDSGADGGPEARALARKLVDLAWKSCAPGPVRDALAATGRYVGRVYPTGSASASEVSDFSAGSVQG
jgi:hypothetical protein